METETKEEPHCDPTFFWMASLQDLPILHFFGEVCKVFGFPESYDTRDAIPGMRHEVWETRGLYFTYLDNREQKENADVIIVCTKEETKDSILRVLSRVAKKRQRRR